MTINWKQGLFAAALLLSASLLFVGCGKCKTDKAVADKSTGEIVGEEIDVIEVVPAQSPNAKTNAKEQSAETPSAPAQPDNDVPAMTPPATSPAPATDAPPAQTPESTTPDATPSSATSDVTSSTSCSETTSDSDIENSMESEPVTESESAYCCSFYNAAEACSPACAPSMEACQPACDAAAACEPDPVCNPPICPPVPACMPVCRPHCMPCRCQFLRYLCIPFFTCCRMEKPYYYRTSSPCSAACDPACQSIDCTSGDSARAWSNENVNPTEGSAQPQNNANKSRELPNPKINEGAQKAKPSVPVGSTPTTPESPSIVLPEAK